MRSHVLSLLVLAATFGATTALPHQHGSAIEELKYDKFANVDKRMPFVPYKYDDDEYNESVEEDRRRAPHQHGSAIEELKYDKFATVEKRNDKPPSVDKRGEAGEKHYAAVTKAEFKYNEGDDDVRVEELIFA